MSQRYQNYGYVRNPAGLYTALDGEKVKRVNFFKNLDPAALYETDIHPEMRTLIDRYWDSDDISTGHTTMAFDIEVESGEGFPEPAMAKQQVTAISMYIKETGKFYVLVLDREGLVKDSVEGDVTIARFDSEEDLLLTFMEMYKAISPTILTGWNITKFDVPYLYNRMTNTLGDAVANRLSPIGKVYETHLENGTYGIAGVNVLDYIELYKKFELNQKPSYTLDYISKLELGRGKVTFQGSIQRLFETDIKRFIEYSLTDVDLVKALDEKLDYIEQTKMVCHMGHVKYEDILFSSKYIEGTILTYLKNHGIVAPNRHTKFDIKTSKTGNPKGAKRLVVVGNIPDHIPLEGTISYRKSPSVKKELEYQGIEGNTFVLVDQLTEDVKAEYLVAIEFIGAYVKPPVPGKYDWIYDLDLKSMYPFTIMSLNISPETKVGYVSKFSVSDFLDNPARRFEVNYFGATIEYDSRELRAFLEGENLSISANGILYRQDKRGLIPTILEIWSAERDRFKKLRTEAKLGGDKAQAKYFDRKQGAQKVLLNSLYGVLGLPVFRFYDIQNATAVTSTGRNLLMHTTRAINFWYNHALPTIKIICDDDTVREYRATDMVAIIRNNEPMTVPATQICESDDII